ncbi:NAD(P)/FAD-dependent oxidoreductase [Roseivivax marinus]|uniref:NAD(P)/FAD-dependent oxidoreductase n=1 Tax=Roseivivax marinus TaxID=1379903 RepID=UPI00273EB6CE|nr:FAD-dependent oxidoreductase [Roseivivax marinus]
MTERVVIVGAGQGGFQAAASLRQEGYEGDITLIGAESSLPYQRPPLSKAYLKSGDAGALSLRPESFYGKNRIEFIPDTRIERIDRDEQVVFSEDASWHYDHLVLATGTRNLRPKIDGLDYAIDLRTLADAQVLREALSEPKRCAVIGGGFIGLEFAAVARSLGHEVSVAEAAPRLMARVVSPEISQRFLDLHERLGTAIKLQSAAREVTSSGISLSSGEDIPADLILLAAGVRPNTELAEAAGLPVENGIIVDANLLTSDRAISALGDCAVFPDPRTGRPVRLESVQAATDHARAISKRIVRGQSDPYAAVPWFWSDQADHKLQIAGLASPSDTSVAIGNDTVLRFDGQTLSAVETVNNQKIHMKTRKLMAQGALLTRDILEDVAYDLTAL